MTSPAFNNPRKWPLATDESVEELYEMAPCGYLTTSSDGHIVKVNRTLADWLGYNPEEMTDGRRFVDLLTVGGRIFYETHLRLLLRMQTNVNEIALDMVCKDGSVLPTLINARQKRDDAGEPILNRFTIFNSTERRMYERQLLAARDLFQTTLSSIGDAVISTGANANVTFMNPVAEDLTGWTAEAALGRPIDEILMLVAGNTGCRVENPLIDALRKGAIVRLASHTMLVSKNGNQIQIDESVSPIRDPAGEVVGAVIVFRDITSRRLAEKVLSDAYELLEIQAAELRRSNQELSQFAYVASHDLRSPLNTIVNFTQLLKSGFGDGLGGEGEKILGFIVGAGQRMSALIDDLLSYARISEEPPAVAAPVDANIQLKAAIENLRSVIGSSGAAIVVHPLPLVRIGETSLCQIFQNLIGNAIHYRSAEPPRIEISALERDGLWRFSFKDNGIGIAPHHHTQIFEAFRRLHGHELPGSGIGLAVCKRMIERSGGRIWVESQLGHGSTFFFTVPR